MNDMIRLDEHRRPVLFIMSIFSFMLWIDTQPLLAQPAAPAGKQWQVVPELTDEFNGSSLDASKWQPDHPYWNGREPSQFTPNNVSVSGGNLRLKSTVKDWNKQGNWVWSACVTSQTKAMKKGFYSEARIKCSSLSMTGAYWFQGNYSEIDVIENFGAPSNPSYADHDHHMKTNLHYFANGWNNDITSPWEANILSPACDDAYFTYGVWWKDAWTIVFYLNGQEVHTSTPGGAFNEDMYMFFDTEVFSWGIGHPTLASLDNDAINTQLVDWVHTYELVDGGSSGPETVSCDNLPSSVASGNSIQVSVPYEASQNRDVVVEFWDNSWLGEGKTTVSAGSGTAQVTINLANAPTSGGGYAFKASIRPVGGDWTSNIDICQTNGVTVTSGSGGGQTPYGGSNRYIPGVIEAEHYDVGGEGVAYHDTSAGNAGGQIRSDDVDIEARDGGHNVGWTANGEWLEYTVNATNGTYDLEARVASNSADKSLVVKLDGATLGTINVPNTGGWGNFQTVSLNNLSIAGGNNKVLRIEFAGGGVNFNWLNFTSSSPPVNESVDCGPLPTSLVSQNSYTVSVPYVASQSRDVVVEFWNSGWIAEGKTTVSSGSGNTSVTVNLPGAPTAGSNYLWKASIRPVGTDWTQNIDACNQNNVTVTSASCDVPYSAPNITITQQTLNWSSGVIDISCVGSVNLSLIAEGVGPMENADYLNIYYKVNGGAQVALLENSNTYASNTLSANGISGSTLEILVNGYTSWSDETYNVSNISVVSTSGARLHPTLTSNKDLLDKIRVYPNPLISGALKLSLDDVNLNGTLSLFTLNGTNVFSSSGVLSEMSIGRNSFPGAGIYVLQVIYDNHVFTDKLIVR